MARVKCITMQRDEGTLLAAWLRHHGTLFGFDNLVVFDNGSVERRTVGLLKDAERAGVEVRWTHRGRADLEQRGAHVVNLMRAWAEKGVEYDIALPLDCDEFLVAWTRTGLDCRRATIEAELEGARGSDQALAIGHALFNVPGRPGWFAIEAQAKAALPAHPGGTIDGAFRTAVSARAPGLRGTRLATLHFRNKPLREMRARARVRFEGLPDGHVHHGPGAHLAEIAKLDDAAYMKRDEHRLLLGFPAFGAMMTALGIESRLLGAPPPAARRVPPDQVAFMQPSEGAAPVWFDGSGYLAANPDVAGAEWPAALHYALHGSGEGRGAPGESFEAPARAE